MNRWVAGLTLLVDIGALLIGHVAGLLNRVVPIRGGRNSHSDRVEEMTTSLTCIYRTTVLDRL
jgi:hypothetical protein